MIKDERNYHQRLQEFCDCFMETDFKELKAASKGVSGDPSGDPDELGLKFLGIALLYGANEEAKRISIQRSKAGKVLFSVDARGNYQLPPPSVQVADRIFARKAPAHYRYRERSGKDPAFLGIEK